VPPLLTRKFLTLLALALGACLPLAGQAADDGATFDLTILHINDHHSHLDAERTALTLKDAAGAARKVTVELGGFARVAQAIEELSAAAGGNVLKLHAGDAITGDLYFTQSAGAADAAAMNSVCFDAFALGNHEFDSGDAGLAKFLGFLHPAGGKCRTPVLSANLAPAGAALKELVQPYTIVRRAGQDIGIIGITTAYKTMHASRPDAGTILADELTAAQAAIDRLKALGVNKIILLSHQGYDADMTMATQLDGVDVIVGGDSHTLLGPADLQQFGLTPAGPYPTSAADKTGKRVCIVQAWQYAYAVGELKVRFDGDGDVVACGGMPHILVGERYQVGTTPPAAADATAFRVGIAASGGLIRTTAAADATTSALAPYRAAKEGMNRQVVGRAAENLCLRRVPGTQRDTTRSALGDTCNRDADGINHGGAVPQLVTAAFLAQGRRYGGADIALQNAGAARIDMAAGDITIGTIYRLLPFKNLLLRLTLSGAELKSTLEDAIDSVLHGTGSGAYPYAAGLRFEVDMSQAKGARVNNLQFQEADGRWVPLAMTKIYRTITNDFTAGGGDNYATLQAVPPARRENTFLDYADAFLEYVKEQGTLTRPPATAYSTQTYIEAP